MKKVLFILAFLTGITACHRQTDQNQYAELSKAEWLIGSWENTSPEGTMTETWERRNDSLFTGRSFFMRGSDTVSNESIELKQLGADVFYVPTVSNQNGGKPVSFKLTSSGEKSMEFENPGHDFPQKISYKQLGTDSLAAEISGQLNGKPRSAVFYMTRVK